MNIDLWKDCNNIILWGVERILAYNLLDTLQHQNVYALVPNNELKQALKKKLEEQGSDANLNIEQAYLNDKEGEAILREFNLPQLNSINPPSGIFDVYPGLKQLQMQSVKCLSPNSLLTGYELSNQVNNTLWLEINGQITSTITAIIETKEIYLFSTLFVFMPDQAWYKSEIDADKLILKLKQMGYDDFSQMSDLDTDQKLYEFRRHRLVLAKTALESEVINVRQVLIQAQDQNAELDKKLQTTLTEKMGLEKQTEESFKDKDTLSSERDNARKERNSLKSKLEQKDKQIALLSKQLKNTQVQLNDAKVISANLSSENNQMTNQQKQLESQLTKAEVQIDIIKDLLIKPKSHD